MDSLRQMSDYGVTTALDMATWPPGLVTSLRGTPGLTDIRSVGTLAAPPGSSQSKMPGFPQDALVSSADQAEQFVADRIAEGSEYQQDSSTSGSMARRRRLGKARCWVSQNRVCLAQVRIRGYCRGRIRPRQWIHQRLFILGQR